MATHNITLEQRMINEQFETRRPCPNCGKIHLAIDLRYHSSEPIIGINGIIGGMLYGVCKECAERHTRNNKTLSLTHK